MNLDPEIAQWFKGGILYAGAKDAAVAARWGAVATVSSIDSPLAFKPAADEEAARQLALWRGPLAQDELIVPGDRKDLRLRCITLQADRLGYEAGMTVFVLGTEPAAGNMTKLTVIRRL